MRVLFVLAWLVMSRGILQAQTVSNRIEQLLNLPVAVEIEAFTYNNGEKEAVDQLKVVSQRNWAQASQSLNHGELGFVLHRTDVLSDNDATVYTIPEKRAMRYRTGSRPPMIAIEPWTTPLAWVRLLRWHEEHGGKIDWSESPDGFGASADIPTDPQLKRTMLVRLSWNNSSHQLTVRSGWHADYLTEHRFLNWQRYSDGSSHPQLVEIDFGSKPEDTKKTVLLTVNQSHNPAMNAPQLVLPDDAIVLDLDSGQQTDSKGLPLEVSKIDPRLIPLRDPTQMPDYRSPWRWVWLLGISAGFGTLALFWWRKRRAA